MATKTRTPSRRKGQRAAWKGSLRFGMVSIPVRAFPAKSERTDVDLHWLHEECLSRIRYVKTCPIHGEVPNDELVSGYKRGRQNYIVVDPEEVAALKAKRQDTIEIMAAVGTNDIDDIYYTDKSYFLFPDGENAARPYTVFHDALERQERYGVAEAVMFKREHLVVVRPMERLLVLTMLTYPDRVKDASELAGQLPRVSSTPREMALATSLIQQLSDEPFDIHQFQDRYAEDLLRLIEAKSRGHELAAAPITDEEPTPLSFLDALQKSVEAARKRKGAHRRKVS